MGKAPSHAVTDQTQDSPLPMGVKYVYLTKLILDKVCKTARASLTLRWRPLHKLNSPLLFTRPADKSDHNLRSQNVDTVCFGQCGLNCSAKSTCHDHGTLQVMETLAGAF
jgi:hypothetical protein